MRNLIRFTVAVFLTGIIYPGAIDAQSKRPLILDDQARIRSVGDPRVFSRWQMGRLHGRHD